MKQDLNSPALFIIAGNPPANHFYELWKLDILEILPQAKIFVAIYPEVPTNLKSADAMSEIADELSRQLQNFSKEVAAPVHIIGHSLGGYFGYEILKKNSHLIGILYLVHPFLRMPLKQGRIILKFLKHIQENVIMRKLVLRSRRILEPLAPDLMHVSNAELVSSLALAYHEQHTIAQDISSLAIPKELQPKIKMYFVPGDIWCTSQVVESLRSQVQVTQVSEPHAFVMFRKHRQSLLQKIIADQN